MPTQAVPAPDSPDLAAAGGPVDGTCLVLSLKRRVAPASAAAQGPRDAERPHSFGREDQSALDGLSYDQLKRRLRLASPSEAVLSMVALVHFNPKTPANSNVRAVAQPPDTNERVLQVFRRGRWRTEDGHEAVMDLLARNRLRFYDIEHVLRDRMLKTRFEALQQYLDCLEAVCNGTAVPDADSRALVARVWELIAKAKPAK